MADSKVQANENINLGLINKSEIKGSTVGMKVNASDSRVQTNKNINLNIVNGSKVSDSTVGMEVNCRVKY